MGKWNNRDCMGKMKMIGSQLFVIVQRTDFT